jgi:hypothetical protein
VYLPAGTQSTTARGYRVNKTVLYRPGGEAAFLKNVYDITQRVADTALDVLLNRLLSRLAESQRRRYVGVLSQEPVSSCDTQLSLISGSIIG